MRSLRGLRSRFSPIVQTPTIDDGSAMLESVTSAFTAAGMSAVVAAVCYHLAGIRLFGFDRLMEGLGNLFIPASQPLDLANGYLGIYGGVFIVYVAALLIMFGTNLRLPGITLQRLPGFILFSGVLNAILGWSLFFPWIGLE